MIPEAGAITDEIERIRRALGPRYVVDRELGRGGMGTVYLAQDVKHGRRVAIKTLHPELASAVAGQRFLREIALAARLQHPHIVPLYDSGEQDDVLFFAMPYIEGESLRSRLDRERQLPIDETTRITRDVALALDYAHAHGVVHRDVKPDNILLVSGLAMVADFGIARAVSVAAGERLTQSGIVIGSPHYMSPEQAAGEPPRDGLGDQYSLACVAYEMLVGEPPFHGSTPNAILARHSLDPMPSIRTVRSTVPDGVESAIARAMSKTPADRFRSVTQFAEAISSAAKELFATAPKRTPVSWRLTAGFVLIIALALGVAAVTSAIRSRGAPTPSVPAMPRIAVIRFTNLGTAADQFLADGLTDELITRVGGLSRVEVISRMSTLQYDRRRTSIKQIARELGADFVLTGTIRTDRRSDGSGETRVSPELIRASDEKVIWRGQEDATLVPGALFEVQSAVAESVAVAINVGILMPERVALQARPTDNLPAYEDYLRGNVYASQSRAVEPTRLAIQAYTRATVRDPGFALAFAKLSQMQSLNYSIDRSPERQRDARRALDSALALDPSLPAAVVAGGLYHFWVLRNYDSAFVYLSAASKSEPNNAQVLSALGVVLRSQGRWNDAMVLTKKAADLDPRSYAFDFATSAAWKKRYEEANSYYLKSIALSPDFLPAYLSRSYLYLEWRGDTVSARQILGSAARYVDSTTILIELVSRFRGHIAILDKPWQDKLERLSLRDAPLDSGAYYLAEAEQRLRRADPTRARTYFDSARMVFEPRARAHPGDAIFQSELGLAYVGIGRVADGIKAGERAMALVPASQNATAHAFLSISLVRIYILGGRYNDAINELRRIEKLGQADGSGVISSAFLRVHPYFAPLRPLPRFQELLREGA